MKTLTKGMAALVLAAAAAGCDGSPVAGSAFVSGSGRTGAAESPGVLTFASTQSFSNPTPQTASGGIAGIDFTGSLSTGNPCYTLTATHATSGNDVTVTVTAASTAPPGTACAQVVTHNNYTGRVSALLPGTYGFTVLHVYRGTTTTAFSGTVTVQ